MKTIMMNTGSALMGIGQATGENRAVDAARKAISSPLLETSIEGAKGVLLNITGGQNLTLFEVNEASEIIAAAADPEANIIFGAVIDDNMKEEVRVTVIATGFDQRTLVLPGHAKAQDRIIPVTNDSDLDIPEFLRRRL